MGLTKDPILCVASFLQESSAIEGYDVPLADYLKGLQRGTHKNIHVKNSVMAWTYVEENRKTELTEELILKLHAFQMAGLLRSAGKWRNGWVRVGSHVAPNPQKIPMLMLDFIQAFNKKERSSWELHCQFEHVHPFPDGNGRTGRLLWAWDLLQRNRAVYPLLESCITPNPKDVASHGIFYASRFAYYQALSAYHKTQD